jgi:hypothetical protein
MMEAGFVAADKLRTGCGNDVRCGRSFHTGRQSVDDREVVPVALHIVSTVGDDRNIVATVSRSGGAWSFIHKFTSPVTTTD